MNSIDLYDTPIDLRPIPKLSVENCIAHLQEKGDFYGVNLLKALTAQTQSHASKKDIADSECPR